jgi:hypothetical protein
LASLSLNKRVSRCFRTDWSNLFDCSRKRIFRYIKIEARLQIHPQGGRCVERLASRYAVSAVTGVSSRISRSWCE